MARLNQIIAVANGKKSRAQAALTEVYQKLQKSELLQGISRNYRPRDDEGDKLPPESKRVQYRVSEAIQEAQTILGEVYNVVATQDAANCRAMADVVVDGNVLLAAVPVTHLLYLEKQLVDLHTLVDKLPTLDSGEEWTYSAEADCYATKPAETTRTKKVPKNHVKAEATDKHPAQVEVYMEDIIVGTWQTIKFSGSIPEQQKRTLRARVRTLQDAVKRAREEANSFEIKDGQQVAKPLFDYLFAKEE
jgi:hypothetical protein